MSLRRPLLYIAASFSLSLPSASIAQSSVPQLAPEATTVFHSNQNGALWSDSDYSALIAAIQSLDGHGLNPEHYHLTALLAQRGNSKTRDKIATDAWLSAAAHIVYGKLSPTSVEPDWTAAGRKADLSGLLSGALKTHTIEASFDDLAPKHNAYSGLKAEYKRLKQKSANPSLKIPAGETLKPGMSAPRVAQLQRRLVDMGYSVPATGVMDSLTIDAVKAIQIEAGLDDDGVVGPQTLRAINRGEEEKLDALRVNMERWRWLEDDLGRRHLRANIADFNVTAWADGKPVRTYLTIVGRDYRKTPVFSDKVAYAVFNPWWETPRSLTVKDKLPAFKRDPSSVKRLGFQILDKDGKSVNPDTLDWNSFSASNFPYRIRQAPGEQNALGQVKIIFPNKHNVYFHDTPTRGLFSQRQRAFSSGCLRTQNPIDLSEWLLAETPNWTRQAIDATLASGKETRANLKEKVPVHILYLTTVNEEGGGVRYLDDIYARDAGILAGLKTAP